MSQDSIKICMVAVHSYPVINPSARGLFGGMETRSWTFAREIATLPGTEVSFVVTHRMAPRTSFVDRVRIVEATTRMDWCHQDLSAARNSWRGNRGFSLKELAVLAIKSLTWTVTRPFRLANHLRWLTPSRWLMALDADVYVAFGINSQSAWTAISARAIQRPFVLCLTCDSDLDRRFLDDADYIDPYGASSMVAKRLLGESDGVIVQTMLQQQQMKKVWQRDSVMIANPLDLAAWDEAMRSPPPTEAPAAPFVLWVGRADRFAKRPFEMLAVIKAHPEIPFVMVLNPKDPEVFAQVQNVHCANLTLIEQVSPRQMAALMRCSVVFASTSSPEFEGMPNVVIQAAATSRPIVSLEASAEWLQASGAGACTNGDRELFSNTIARFFSERDSPEIQKLAEAGRAYVEREHDSHQQSVKFLDAIRGIMGSHASTTSNAAEH